MMGCQVARMILDQAGLACPIVVGRFDHYDCKRKHLILSPGVFYGTEIYGIAIAAHEVGHAIQDASGALRIRTSLIPFAQAAAGILPFGLLGLFFAPLFWLAAPSITVLFAFRLLNITTELDATNRAIKTLDRILTKSELRKVRHVLRWALLSYCVP